MQTVRSLIDPRLIAKVAVSASTGFEVPGLFALQRTGDAPMPGIGVGSRYTVLQDSELADMADEAARRLGLTGEPRVITWNGTRVSVLLPLDRFGVGIGQEDITEARLRIDNPHGGGAALVALDLLRKICANGMMRRVGGSRHGIPHTLSVEQRVRRLVEQAGAVRLALSQEVRLSRALADRALSQADLQAFFLQVHARSYGPVQTPEGEPRKSAVERVAAWVRNLEDPRQAVAGIQGTAWAALQAVTQWADHEAPSRDRARSADHGTLAKVKAHARSTALEYLR